MTDRINMAEREARQRLIDANEIGNRGGRVVSKAPCDVVVKIKDGKTTSDGGKRFKITFRLTLDALAKITTGKRIKVSYIADEHRFYFKVPENPSTGYAVNVTDAKIQKAVFAITVYDETPYIDTVGNYNIHYDRLADRYYIDTTQKL